MEADETATGVRRALHLEVEHNGAGRLFCARAADTMASGQKVLFEQIVAGNLAVALAFLGGLYEGARYSGLVDVGVAVAGIEGAVSFAVHREGFWSGHGFREDGDRRTGRFPARRLATEPREVALELTGPLFTAISPPEYDPFA